MIIGIIRFPGSNCDLDTERYFKDDADVSCIYIWHKQSSLSELNVKIDMLIIPGGFAFGNIIY